MAKQSKLRLSLKCSLGATFLEYIWAIAVILEGNSVYRHLSDRYLHLTFICMLTSAILFLVKCKGKLRKNAIFSGLFFFGYVLLYYTLKRNSLSGEVFVSTVLFGLPIMIMLFDLYISQGEPYRLFVCLSNVMLVLTILSLTVWFIGSVLHLIPFNSFVHINWGRDKIINGYFGLQYDVAMDTTYGITDFYRNQSLFTEAPMFSLWLCIALSTEVFLTERISKVRCAIFVAGILSAISTAGIIFCMLVLILLYFEEISKGKAIRKAILSFLLIALIPFGIYIAQIIYNYKSSTLSFAWRMQDYVTGWKVFMENPLFGTGFGIIDSVISKQSITLAGYSNSVTALIGTGGLWITALFILSLVGYFTFRDRNNTIVKFGICYLFLYIMLIFFARYIAFVFFGFGISLLLNRKKKYSSAEESNRNFSMYDLRIKSRSTSI